MARDMPRITAPMTPDTAAGTTTRKAVSSRVAPIAKEPSRIERGTARMASSDSEAMYGMIINPITRPAPSKLNDGSSMPKGRSHCCSSGVTNSSAK
jgi:hypothetical protein